MHLCINFIFRYFLIVVLELSKQAASIPTGALNRKGKKKPQKQKQNKTSGNSGFKLIESSPGRDN